MDRRLCQMAYQLGRLADCEADARVEALLRRAQHATRAGDFREAQRALDEAHCAALTRAPRAAA